MNSRIDVKKIFFFCLVTILAVSCTVKKRSYTKGYYVDWAFKSSKSKEKIEKKEAVASVPKTKKIPETHTVKEEEVNQNDIEAVTVTQLNAPIVKQRGVYKLDEPCGDLLTLRNGDEINVKVVELTDNLVKYKRCDNLDGPLISISKSKVFSVKYKNGTKELFKETEVATQSKTSVNKIDESKLRIHPLSVIAFILSILGIAFVPFSIIALILASYAIKQINKKPNIYKGEYLARIAKIIAGVIIALWLFLIFLLIIVALLA